MKTITKNTILKQGNKTYQPVEVNGVIYWVNENIKGESGWNYNYDLKRLEKLPYSYPSHSAEWNFCRKLVAQSSSKLEGIPVISLDSYIEQLADDCVKNNPADRAFNEDGWMIEQLASTGFVYGYKSNPNQYTQKDIEKTIELATKSNFDARLRYDDLKNQVIDQINSISVIEVDENFNIISYE